LPHELTGVEVLALPFTVADDVPVLGAGAAEAGRSIGLDLAALLTTRRVTGKGGEVVAVPIGGPDLRLLLLVGLGEETDTDDSTGVVVRRADPPDDSAISRAVERLTGVVI